MDCLTQSLSSQNSQEPPHSKFKPGQHYENTLAKVEGYTISTVYIINFKYYIYSLFFCICTGPCKCQKQNYLSFTLFSISLLICCLGHPYKKGARSTFSAQSSLAFVSVNTFHIGETLRDPSPTKHRQPGRQDDVISVFKSYLELLVSKGRKHRKGVG